LPAAILQPDLGSPLRLHYVGNLRPVTGVRAVTSMHHPPVESNANVFNHLQTCTPGPLHVLPAGHTLTHERSTERAMADLKYDPKERAQEKQASREADAQALATRQVSREELRRRNGRFAFPRARLLLDRARLY